MNQTAFKLQLNVEKGFFHAAFIGNVVLGREDIHMFEAFDNFTADAVEAGDGFDFIAKEAHADGVPVAVGRHYFQGVAAHAEDARLGFHVVALVLDIHQLTQQGVAAGYLPRLQMNDALVVNRRVAQAVDGRNRGHDDNILARE